jgi:hypothetical protein
MVKGVAKPHPGMKDDGDGKTLRGFVRSFEMTAPDPSCNGV